MKNRAAALAGLALQAAGLGLAFAVLSGLSYTEPTVDAVTEANRASKVLLAAAAAGAAGAVLVPGPWRKAALAVPPVLAAAADAVWHNSLMPHFAVALWVLALVAVLPSLMSRPAQS